MKVLKVAAIVVGVVALAATGVGFALGATSLSMAFAGGLGAIGLGGLGALGFGAISAIALGAIAMDLSMLAGAIAPKPTGGGSQTKWKADPYAGIPYVMGRTLVGGNIVYKRGHGLNNKFLTTVTILGLGPFASIDATYMDHTATAFNGAGAATGTYSGQIWQRTQLGACPEASALSPPVDNPPGWTAAHKLSGLCAAMNTYAYDSKSENGLTSIPPPSWIAHACLVYDPRLDDTYPGGSGSCRAYDESTYVWSEDPHLHGLTWAMGRYHNGTRVAGIGAGENVPGGAVKGVDVASFVEGANLNDARGWKIGGQVYTRPDTLWNSLKAMLQAGGARPVLVGGIISCVNRAPKVSLATITRDDIVGACDFAGTQPKRGRINGIIPQYRSEQHDWEMVSASRVSVPDFETLDGDERTRELPYPLVQQVDQVAQLATYDIYDLREAGPGTVPLKPAWLNYKIGDCLTYEPEDGFSIKTQVTGRGIDPQGGAVTFTLRGETDGKHAYALGETGTPPPIASLVYTDDVAAPDAADWSLAGTQLTSDGASLPILQVSGACANPSADAVLIDYRPHIDGQADTAGWYGASVEVPTVTTKNITSVIGQSDYDVSIQYRVRGRVGARLIIGPATSGTFTPGPQGPPGADGLDGSDGLPGADGADGQSSYVHFAYANSADGTTNFTTGAPGSRTYIGVYTDFAVADSSSPSAYSWSLIKGADGTNGIPGADGADGQPSYVHIAYANSADGTTDFDLSDPVGRTYIGVYTDSVLADSSDPAAYTWSLIKGADGVSPVGISPSPSSVVIKLDAAGNVKSGELPVPFEIRATKNGGAVAVDNVTITSSSGGSWTKSGSTINLTGITGGAASGECIFSVTAGGQTLAGNSINFSTSPDAANAAQSSKQWTATPAQASSASFVQSGPTLAFNARDDGTLDVNLSGNIKPDGGGYQFTSKLQYSLNGGTSYSDVSGSQHDSSISDEFTIGDGGPVKITSANVSSTGPYHLTGLGAGTAVLLRAMIMKKSAAGTSTTSGSLTLFADAS